MKKYIFLLLLLLLTACQSEQYPNIQQKLADMTSYCTNAEITYFSNKGNTTYSTLINALFDGRYRIDIISPEDYKGNTVLYDGKLVWQYNPNLKDNKISANPPEKASRREIILFSFLKNYNTNVQTKAEGTPAQTVLETPLNSSNPMFSYEKLFTDDKKLLPSKLVIYDNQNKERVVVKFSNFEYNKKIEDSLFKLE